MHVKLKTLKPASIFQRNPLAARGLHAEYLGMRRVLRSGDTEMFIKSDGKETSFFEEGQAFEGFGDAVAFCKRHKLKHVELVLREHSPKDEITIQLNGMIS
jgi:hypothetical protein